MARGLRQKQEKQMVCVCCVCGKARDDIAAKATWTSLKAHLRRYGMVEKKLIFSHTFCPGCFMHYKEILSSVFGHAVGGREAAQGGRPRRVSARA
jgi:hypothetical protein